MVISDPANSLLHVTVVPLGNTLVCPSALYGHTDDPQLIVPLSGFVRASLSGHVSSASGAFTCISK